MNLMWWRRGRRTSRTVRNWDTIDAAEQALIDDRRKQLRVETVPAAPYAGLALSGGGIRSATFSLGLLKGLSSARLLKRIDYLSSVSGGGYAAAFLRSLFVPSELRGPGRRTPESPTQCKQRSDDLGDDPLGSPDGRKALAQLREGGHFLNPNGTSDALFAMVVALRNWLAAALVSGLMLLAVFLSLNLLRIADTQWLREAATPALALAGQTAFPAETKRAEPEKPPNQPKGTDPRTNPVAPETPSGTAAVEKAAAGGAVSCSARIGPGTALPSATCTGAPAAPPAAAPAAAPGRKASALPAAGSGAIAQTAPNATAKAKPAVDGGPGELLGASWLWIAAFVLLPLWPGPCAWAYWQTRSPPVTASRFWRLVSLPTLVAISFAALLALLIATDRSLVWAEVVLGAATALSAVLGIVFYIAAMDAVARGERSQAAVDAPPQDGDAWWTAEEDRIRARLSRWLFRGLFLSLGIAALALADDAGRLVYYLTMDHITWSVATGTGTLGAASLLIVPVARFLLKRVQSSGALNWQKFGPAVRQFGRLMALAAGLVLGTALVVFWSACAYAIFWHGNPVTASGPVVAWPPVYLGGEQRWAAGWQTPVAITILVVSWALLLGFVRSFLNRSSLAPFYAARLRKAYLGASNPDRWEEHTPPDVELPSDEIELEAYHHAAVLAPLHLINVTVNETTSDSSRVIQRDRKGKPMVVSPAGYVFAGGAPTEPASGFLLGQGEQLPLSTWMGISGAAFSTGMGQHGSFGMSLLAALTNLRLGYWWDSPRPGRLRSVEAAGQPGWRHRVRAARDWWDDLVQSYLLRELRADFEGTHTNLWYLSDGGHFENMGVYELVRRRLPFIVASDNGADPNYEFADFINLVRKIRIDFDAETEMVSAEELDSLLGKEGRLREAFGTLAEIGASAIDPKTRRAGPYATLARIRLPAQTDGAPARREPVVATLLMIKPRIAGGELPDILRYHKKDAAFPQQRTTDLFFDEAQWESYFRLGQLIAEAIFSRKADEDAEAAGATWLPSALKPLAPVPPPPPPPAKAAPPALPAPPPAADGILRKAVRWLLGEPKAPDSA